MNTDALLADECRAVLHGAPVAKLVDTVQSIQSSVLSIQMEFTDTTASLDAHIRHICSANIESISNRIDTLQRLNLQLQGRLWRPLRTDLLELAESIDTERARLAGEIAAFHNRALMAMGPTRMPGANRFLHRLNAGARGLELMELSRSEIDNSTALLGALQTEEAAPAVLKAVQMYINTMHRSVLPRNASPTQVVAVRSAIEQAAEQLYDVLQAHRELVVRQGPTPFPQVNLVLHLLHAAWVDPAVRPGLHEAIQLLRDLTGRLVHEVASLEIGSEDSVAARAAVDQLQGALAEWRHFVDELPALVDELPASEVAVRMRTLADALALVSADIHRMSESEGQIRCLRCSALNRDRRACGKCGLPLVRPSASCEGLVGVVDASTLSNWLETLVDRSADVAEGLAEPDELRSALTTMEEVVQAVRDFPGWWWTEELEAQCQEALELYRVYLETRDVQLLVEAFSVVKPTVEALACC